MVSARALMRFHARACARASARSHSAVGAAFLRAIRLSRTAMGTHNILEISASHRAVDLCNAASGVFFCRVEFRDREVALRWPSIHSGETVSTCGRVWRRSSTRFLQTNIDLQGNIDIVQLYRVMSNSRVRHRRYSVIGAYRSGAPLSFCTLLVHRFPHKSQVINRT